jgi:hypothetical protein
MIEKRRNPNAGRTLTRRSFLRGAVVAGAALYAGPASKADRGEPTGELTGWHALERAFFDPPDESKPWAYWWWLNGDVSREGITRDLQEMKRQGINGVLVFHAGADVGVPIGPRFLSPEWIELFQFAVKEAARLGMEMSVNLCDGWDAGGPWIEPEHAAKKLVFSEVQADGPGKRSIRLPMPLVVDGYYRDVAVVAFHEKSQWPIRPAAVEASSALQGYCYELNWPPLDTVDGDPNTFWRADPKLAPTPQNPQWIQWRYHEPLTACAVHLVPPPTGGPRDCKLQASDDGRLFRTVATFQMEKGEAKRVDFPQTAAIVFRLLINSAHAPDVQLAEGWLLRDGDEPRSRPGIKWWWFKSGNRSFFDYPKQGPACLEEEYPDDGAFDVRKNEVVDLTSRMAADGSLDWEIPQGRWTILRFGYTLLGQKTRASTAGDIGYESDVLDAKGSERHFRYVAEPVLRAAAGEAGRTVKYLHVDSYEVGADVQGQQPTWSERFRDEFKVRRGYDLLPYLPALAGRILDSRERTDRFLWDIRRTIGDLMAERYYGRLAELAHARGVGFHTEAAYGYPYPHADILRCMGMADIPMGEFWHATDIVSQVDYFCNVIRSAASAAHTYGKRIAQAEAFTSLSNWQEYPAALKAEGDRALCDGLNRNVLCFYVHQPRPKEKPGIEWTGVGTHFDCNITWWEQGRAWLRYLARCQHLLQQGKFHADVCYFYGEGSTRFVPGREYMQPALPAGYNYDCVNSEVLLSLMSVQEGRLRLPNGTSYGLMVLPEQRTMSPEALRRIEELIQAGATVTGPRPLRVPGLSGYPDCDSELKALVGAMWGAEDSETGERRIGKGQLVWGESLDKVLRSLSLPPDFHVSGGDAETKIEFTHRDLEGVDAYFLSNQKNRVEMLECAFRVAGRHPELWDPVTGAIRNLPEFRVEGGRTFLPLRFEPLQSWFVVFRKPIASPRRTAEKNFPAIQTVMQMAGPWKVSFNPDWGGPESVTFDRLQDWTERPEEGIKYYSGAATYRKKFDKPKGTTGKRLYLALGTVNYLAEVRLNGKHLGVVWCAPWRVEITEAVRGRGNELEIDVVNLWPNRLIGDAGLPPEKQLTKTNVRTFKAGAPLLPSGLLGPVKLEATV